MESELTIGQLASRSGVSASALRFYEEKRLISSCRTESGHRRYSRAVLRRVAFIVFGQKIGLSLDELAELLRSLPQNAVPVKKDWARLSRQWAQRIDERIAELQQLRQGLTHCIGCGCLSLQACKISNPNDIAARFGSGPLAWRSAKLEGSL